MPKVHVPQPDGEVVVARNGEEAKTYRVTDHQVTVKEEDLQHFLGVVEGSKPDGGSSAASTPKEK